MSAPIDPARGISATEEITGLERTSIWRRCRAGTFPTPFFVGNRRFWRQSQLDEWLRQETARPASARRGAANLLGAAQAAAQ